jgi:hypothetical protein
MYSRYGNILKRDEKLFVRVLNNRELVHPVHQRVALFDNAFELTRNAGDQLIAGKKIGGADRHPFRTQKIRLDPPFFKLNPIDEPTLLKTFNNPRTFTAVNTQFLPEFALEYAFGS